MLEKSILNAGLEYVVNLKVIDYCPSWSITVGANYFEKKQMVSVYPYYREQTINSYNIYTFVEKGIVKNRNRYGISVGYAYGTGSGMPKKDGLYTTPSSEQKEPQSMEQYLYQEYEYLTANRMKGRIGFELSRLLTQSLRGYAKFGYEQAVAFNTDYMKNNTHRTFDIAIGCAF
ncbi:MAG: hypothetical protein LBH34_05090 [Prevotellaceae bacterium]|jgi:hypothetical protein|nr:hypothetical protein [Prevotellaceae bacterium]